MQQRKRRILLSFVMIMTVLIAALAGSIMVQAAGISIMPAKVTLNVGDIKTLTINGTTKDQLGKTIWNSSRKTVATVSKTGKVTAKAEGSATITAVFGKKSYTCEITVKKNITSTNEKILKTASDARRESILNQNTEIVKSNKFIPGETYTGTAYYVSSNGNDDNSGTSPTEAWKSIAAVNGADLKKGDAVLFERGGIWRLSATLHCREGVTYSAYGSGAKPLFTESPENGAGADKWELYYEDKSGKKIWKYHRQMTDTGTIVFNDGEEFSDRVYEWWTGKGYVSLDLKWSADRKSGDFFTVKSKGKLLSVEDSLNKNLTSLIRADYSGLSYPIQVYDACRQGTLYLRCDAGNPGEIYNSIEFETFGDNPEPVLACIGLESHCVADNLAVKYYGEAAIKAYVELDGITVQNCEVAWGGTTLHEFNSKTPSPDYMLSGDGIYGLCNNAVVKNNYVHDVAAVGITFEICEDFAKVTAGNYTCQGNLLENCAQGIWLHDDYNKITMNNILVEDNIVNDTGYGGATYGCFCEYVSIGIENSPSLVKKIMVKNNVINRSKQFLIGTFSYKDVWKKNYTIVEYSGNTYVQDFGKPFAFFPWLNWETWRMKDANTIDNVRTKLRDKFAKVYWMS